MIESKGELEVKNPIFWIGTEAELIKVLPVMKALDERNIQYGVIATGQNPIHQSELLNLLPMRPVIYKLSTGPQVKSTLGLLIWFLQVFVNSLFKLRRAKGDKRILIIHGDTISTLLGAILGWVKNYQIAHVEAGLRSYNYLKPFPEEIDRVLSSAFVDFHYCPNEQAEQNIRDKSAVTVNTQQNTLIDSLELFRKFSNQNDLNLPRRYFVFVLHRQDNLFDTSFVRDIVRLVLNQAEKIHCILILHEPTRSKLEAIGLLEKFTKNSQIVCLPRQEYFKFMNILSRAEFLVTDGGSNQEESYYLGLPCLVLRDSTERNEGLRHNVVLARSNRQAIEKFFREYELYRREPIKLAIRPSDLIADHLQAQI